MSQYRIRLRSGFNATGRRRAGFEIQKGVSEFVELAEEAGNGVITEEQLVALREDEWFDVVEVNEDGEPLDGGEEEVVEEVETPEEEEKTEEETQEDEEGGDEGAGSEEGEEQEVDLATLTDEELIELAGKMGVELNGATKRKKVIKAIEESQANQE